jgi:hypothetical protein
VIPLVLQPRLSIHIPNSSTVTCTTLRQYQDLRCTSLPSTILNWTSLYQKLGYSLSTDDQQLKQLRLSIYSILITNDGCPLANRADNRGCMHPSAFRDAESFMSCCNCASFVDDKAEVAFVFLHTGLRSHCVRGGALNPSYL